MKTLDEVLDRSPDEVAKWERGVFDELVANKYGRLVLCGAGGMGRKVLAGLTRAGTPPLAFADNNPKLAGQSIDGVPVYSAADAVPRFGKDAAFVVTSWGAHSRDRLAQRKQQWRDLGCDTVVSFMSLFWKDAESYLPHYSCNLPHKTFAQAKRIKKLASLWADDVSRAEFLAQVRWRTELDFAGLPAPVGGRTYFPADILTLRPDERMVDCGAFDGDTLSDFLQLNDGEFEKFWALEPDPTNYEKLERFVRELAPEVQARIDLLKIAASDRAQTLRFSADATAGSAAATTGNIEVEARALDEVLADENPTFVKMDIEGAELSALQGARKILTRRRPLLAICVYHLQEHLWEIPEWLREHLSDYQFYLRPHDLEAWDLVCYAVPNERSLPART
ncbi:MAG: FkbM family methyltransferase [Verrucomicrobiota bacterium]|nr:FkbM family methyltransferase [Verrucomicrobiota bacterium]